MNIVSALARRKSVPYSGSSLGYSAGFVDSFNKTPSPSPTSLVREFVGTAYACAGLNAGLVASTPFRLYLKTRRGEQKGRTSKRGDTRALSTKRMDHICKVAQNQTAGAVEVEEVTAHPILDLLNRPNNTIEEDGVAISAYELFEYTSLFQDIVGRCYWYIERNSLGDTPSAIWILAPQFVTPERGSGNGPLVVSYWFAAGGKTRFDPSEVVPFRWHDLFDPYTGGTSPLRACYEKIRLTRDADALTNATIKNGGKPSAVWNPAMDPVSGGSIGEDIAKRITSKFRQAFGRASAGGVMVSEQAGSLQILNWPMNEIIDAVKLGMSKTDICNAFSVPDTKLNRNAVNLAAARTGDYAHAMDAGLPRLRRNESALNQFLIPMYGPEAAERLFIAYDSPEALRDPEMEAAQHKTAAETGAYLRNELREMVGLPAMPWGDQPTIDKNQIAVDPKTGVPIQPVLPAPSAPQDDPDDDADDDEDEKAEKQAKLIADIIAPKLNSLGKRIGRLDKRTRSLSRKVKRGNSTASAKAGVQDTSAAGAAGDNSGTTGSSGSAASDGGLGSPVIANPTTDGKARTLPDGKRISYAVRHVFEKQRAVALSLIDAHRVDDVADESSDQKRKREEEALLAALLALNLDTAEWNRAVADQTVSAYESIATTEGTRLLMQVAQHVPGVNVHQVFNEFESSAKSAADDMSSALGPMINKTTTEMLREGLQKAKDASTEDAPPDYKGVVNEAFNKAAGERADTIGTTEAVRAAMGGEHGAAKTVAALLLTKSLVLQKSWRCQPNACDVCLDYEAAGWIGADDAFDTGIDAPPDAHPMCQCDCAWRLAAA